MINGKSGALALLGALVLCWAAAASAAENSVPVVFGTDKTISVDHIADGMLWNTPSPAAKGDDAADRWSLDPKRLHVCSSLNESDDACPPLDCYWTASADALLLHRSASGSQGLLFDPLSETYLLNATDMEFPLQVGPRASVILHGVCGFEFEVSFFEVDGGAATADFPSRALPAGFALLSLDSIYQGESGLPVMDVRFSEHSQLYNGEFNVRRVVNNWVTLMAGFRWVELCESYESHGTKFDATPFTHSIRAFNHMYGLQLGGDFSFFQRNGGYSQFGQTMLVANQASRFRMNGVLKAGIFYNAASQQTAFSNPGSLGDFAAQAEGSHPTFLGEAGLVATYQFGPHVAVRGGYQLMYVDGVALASRQISSTDLLTTQFAAIETSGSVLYHGANIGLELTW
jgi:hypothetical protein